MRKNAAVARCVRRNVRPARLSASQSPRRLSILQPQRQVPIAAVGRGVGRAAARIRRRSHAAHCRRHAVGRRGRQRIGQRQSAARSDPAGRKDLHFIEVMTCPGGCIGGGQPIGTTPRPCGPACLIRDFLHSLCSDAFRAASFPHVNNATDGSFYCKSHVERVSETIAGFLTRDSSGRRPAQHEPSSDLSIVTNSLSVRGFRNAWRK